MADLLTAATANGAGTGVSMTGPCTVYALDTSVWDGGNARIEISQDATLANYSSCGEQLPGKPFIIGSSGTYYVRAVLVDVGASTSVTVVAFQ